VAVGVAEKDGEEGVGAPGVDGGAGPGAEGDDAGEDPGWDVLVLMALLMIRLAWKRILTRGFVSWRLVGVRQLVRSCRSGGEGCRLRRTGTE
jgi:hypothetical protein